MYGFCQRLEHLWMPTSQIATVGIDGADSAGVGVTAPPVIIPTIGCRMRAARVGFWAVVEGAVFAMSAVIVVLYLSHCHCLLHHLTDGIDLAVAATLGGASKRCD